MGHEFKKQKVQVASVSSAWFYGSGWWKEKAAESLCGGIGNRKYCGIEE